MNTHEQGGGTVDWLMRTHATKDIIKANTDTFILISVINRRLHHYFYTIPFKETYCFKRSAAPSTSLLLIE